MATSVLEKITINMAPVDLGQIDLLVQGGFYQNRTDFIRTAIRNQPNSHSEAVRQTVARKTLVLGLGCSQSTDLTSPAKFALTSTEGYLQPAGPGTSAQDVL